jgi:hypothetical protein
MVAAAHGLPRSLPLRESMRGPTRVRPAAHASWSAELARAIATQRPDGAAPRGATAFDGTTDELRRAVADLLGGLARRCEPLLIAALKRAARAWDQADSFLVIDGDTEGEIAALRRRLAGAAIGGGRAHRATALEGLLAVDATVALVRVFERRLATLLRLRLRSATPELLPDERPFLDLARALGQVAEAWR